MAGKTITEKVDDLAKLTATLNESVKTLKERVDRLEDRSLEATKANNELDKGLSQATKDMERLEKKLDEVLYRRWDLVKAVMLLVLGGLVTVAAQFASTIVQRTAGTPSRGARPPG